MTTFRVSMIGNTYGELTVIDFSHDRYRKSGGLARYWKCQCSCGNIHTVEMGDLRGGHTKSCGCKMGQFMREAKELIPGQAAFNNLYKTYREKCGAGRKISFDLTKEQFKELVTGNCVYCGKQPAQIKKARWTNFIYNGIDRVDNINGYVIGNVVSCCKECNGKKHSVTKEIIEKAYFFLKEQGKL